VNEREAVKKMLRGFALAAQRQDELLASEGPQPEIAIAHFFSALNALKDMGRWPAPRDSVSADGIEEVRRRWAKVQRRCRAKRTKPSPSRPA